MLLVLKIALFSVFLYEFGDAVGSKGNRKNEKRIKIENIQILSILAYSLAPKYTSNVVKMGNTTEMIEELIGTFSHQSNKKEIYLQSDGGDEKVNSQSYLLNTQLMKELAESIAEKIMRIVDEAKIKFDDLAESMKSELNDKSYYSEKVKMIKNVKAMVEWRYAHLREYGESLCRSTAIFYYLLYWQMAMDCPAGRSSIKKWMLEVLMPELEKQLLPIIVHIDPVEKANFGLRLLIRAVPMEKDVKQQLDFAFRIAATKAEECNRYCVNVVGLLKKSVEKAKKPDNLLFEIQTKFAIQLDEWEKAGFSSKSADELEQILFDSDKEENCQKNVNELKHWTDLTDIGAKIISFFKEFIDGLQRAYRREYFSYIAELLAYMVDQLRGKVPAMHVKAAELQLRASLLTMAINNKTMLNQVETINKQWAVKESEEKELVNAAMEMLKGLSQKRSSISGMMDQIDYAFSEYATFAKGVWRRNVFEMNEQREMLERAKKRGGSRLQFSSRSSKSTKMNFEVLNFLKEFYREIVRKYKEKMLPNKLLSKGEPNLDWLRKEVLPKLTKLLLHQQVENGPRLIGTLQTIGGRRVVVVRRITSTSEEETDEDNSLQEENGESSNPIATNSNVNGVQVSDK